MLQVASGYGSALTRESMARELGVDLNDLDRRVAEVAEWTGQTMETEPSPRSAG